MHYIQTVEMAQWLGASLLFQKTQIQFRTNSGCGLWLPVGEPILLTWAGTYTHIHMFTPEHRHIKFFS